MKAERTASGLQGRFKFKTSLTNERSKNIQFNEWGKKRKNLLKVQRELPASQGLAEEHIFSEKDPEVIAAYKLTQVNNVMLLQ